MASMSAFSSGRAAVRRAMSRPSAVKRGRSIGGTGSMKYLTGMFSTIGSMLELMALDSSHGCEEDAVHAGRRAQRAPGQQRPDLVAYVGLRSGNGAVARA